MSRISASERLPSPGISLSITNFGIPISSCDSGSCPAYPDLRRLTQRLHDDAVLLGLLAQRADLILRRIRRVDVEAEPDLLEPDADFPRQAERASEVEVAF